jgi:hypothetical protein
MKLIDDRRVKISKEDKLTSVISVDSFELSKDMKIISNLRYLFEEILDEDELSKFVLSPKSPKLALIEYGKIKSYIQLQKLLTVENRDFISKLKRVNIKPSFADIQKHTYLAESGEEFKRILDSLKSLKSGAIFKAIESNEKELMITTYSSRFAHSKIEDQTFFKMVEVVSLGGGIIRFGFTNRTIGNALIKIKDFAKLNFFLHEEVKWLFEQGAINRFLKTRLDDFGRFEDDNISNEVREIHFKDTLSDEEIEKLERSKSLEQRLKELDKKEAQKAHTNVEEMHTIIKDNSIEPRIKSEIEVNPSIAKAQTIAKSQNEKIEDHYKNLIAQKEAEQKAELELLKVKIEEARRQKDQAKKVFIKSLSNGMSIDEATQALLAQKFNNITVKTVLEDAKYEIILSLQKDEIIAQTTQNLKKTISDLELTRKNLQRSQEIRKTHFENFEKERNKRVEFQKSLEIALVDLERAKNIIMDRNVTIQDIKEQLQESENFIKELESENETLTKELIELKKLYQEAKGNNEKNG